MQPRPFADVRQAMLERARTQRNPFEQADPAAVASALDRLDSVAPDAWAEAFGALAEPHMALGAQAEQSGDTATAAHEYFRAYEYLRVARYPAPTSNGKREAYRAAQQMYLKAAYFFDPPLERVWIPFAGRAEEGQFILADLRIPRAAAEPRPLVVMWGGIDSYKEERRPEALLARGVATLAIDMPGTGEAPLVGSADAERLWDAVFDWIPTRPELDAHRVALFGASTGGYWASKLAHTHREQIRCAVNQSGPAHYAFQADWIARAQLGEYPFELAETLAQAFDGETYENWVTLAPRLSLLDQGVLDRPCAPLLLVNGAHDTVFPIQDMYLLLEHGTPKSARFYADAGHMGGDAAASVILDWLVRHLAP
jgi:pimeloyl-ACP methyl ester carboxylesterase